MKQFIKYVLFLAPMWAFSQNTIDGKTVIVPEEEVNRQSQFLDAETELMLGNFDKALDFYKKFLLDNPENDAAWYGVARTFTSKQDIVNAQDAIKKAVELDPTNVWYQVYQADLMEKTGRPKDALKIYENLTKQNPNIPEFFAKQAYLAVLSGDPKGGLKALDRLEALTGVTEETVSKKYMVFVGMGDNKRAANELRKLVVADPENIENRIRLAGFLAESGEKTAAKEEYFQILKLDPDNATAKMAVLEKTKANNDVVFLQSLQPIFRDPKGPIDSKIKEIAPYLVKLQQGNDAEIKSGLLQLGALLETAHADDPKAWSLSGDILYLSDQPQLALERYKKSIQLNATVFSVWNSALEILQSQKNYAEMLKIAEKAMDAFPNQAKAYYYYGVAANENNKMDDAISQLEQAMLMTGNNVGLKLDIQTQIGIALLKKKDFAGAKDLLENALTKGGNQHAGILENLGDAYYQLGDKEKAIQSWQKANALQKSPALEQKISSGKI